MSGSLPRSRIGNYDTSQYCSLTTLNTSRPPTSAFLPSLKTQDLGTTQVIIFKQPWASTKPVTSLSISPWSPPSSSTHLLRSRTRRSQANTAQTYMQLGNAHARELPRADNYSEFYAQDARVSEYTIITKVDAAFQAVASEAWATLRGTNTRVHYNQPGSFALNQLAYQATAMPLPPDNGGHATHQLLSQHPQANNLPISHSTTLDRTNTFTNLSDLSVKQSRQQDRLVHATSADVHSGTTRQIDSDQTRLTNDPDARRSLHAARELCTVATVPGPPPWSICTSHSKCTRHYIRAIIGALSATPKHNYAQTQRKEHAEALLPLKPDDHVHNSSDSTTSQADAATPKLDTHCPATSIPMDYAQTTKYLAGCHNCKTQFA